MIAQAQITIVDLKDPIVSGTEPTTKIDGMLWLDTSSDDGKDVQKRWDAAENKWVECTIPQEDLNEVQTQITETLAQIEVLTGKIESAVSETKETLSGQLKEVETKVTTVTQNADAITNQITTIKDSIKTNGNSLETFRKEVKTWQTFSETGLELGKSNSPFRVLLSNNQLSFKENEETVAHINNNSLHITRARVKQSLAIGTEDNGFFEWVTVPDGQGLKWGG